MIELDVFLRKKDKIGDGTHPKSTAGDTIGNSSLESSFGDKRENTSGILSSPLIVTSTIRSAILNRLQGTIPCHPKIPKGCSWKKTLKINFNINIWLLIMNTGHLLMGSPTQLIG
jgi:hypothetical protein